MSDHCAEDTACGARRHGAGVGDVGVEIAKHGAVARPEDGQLSCELQDCGPDQRRSGQLRGIGGQVARGEVVRAVEHYIVSGEELLSIVDA